MSKCEIDIEFDRPDRLYLGGETVSGRVRIRVNEDLECNGIALTHFWKTHGRGNCDRGELHEQQLAPGRKFLRGETLNLPFSFVAEREPITYRGNLINVDHYVHVEIDVPWAFDPKAEEEYVVRPGKPPSRVTGQPDPLLKPKVNPWPVKILLVVVFLVILVIAGFLMVLLVPVLLLVGLGYWLLRKAMQSRLGDVELIAPKATVAPGEAWPVEVRFTPRKSFEVNEISVKIVAQESATSGSGTNASTHRHTVFEETHKLHPADRLVAGKPFYRQAALTLPETGAYSFEASDNKVQWWAEVRIDMPGFPDWTQKQTLQMVPREFLQSISVGPMVAKA